MLDKLTLRNVMTPVPLTVKPDTSLVEARKQMKHHNIRHLPVCEDDEVIGLVSERDITVGFSLAKHAAEEESLTVKDICRVQPYTVDIEERFDRVLKYMAVNKIGSALIMESKELVGIITTTDIARACGHYLEYAFENHTS
ncbi:MAG: CBS domain-containing protein [Bdellovibrionales bacterium]|nr:CBS domain-containing protein [Bdellovibrionales bacterium]